MSQTAKSNSTIKVVYIPVYEGVQLLDVAGPAEVLSQANRVLNTLAYELHYVCSNSSGKVVSSAGLCLAAEPLPSNVANAHTLLVPGATESALRLAMQDNALMDWLASAARQVERKASVCSGAFLLGELGLLKGKRVTSHWAAISKLQTEFPEASVEDDALFIHDDDLWTSAGVLSGVDMALAIVARDFSSEIALKIARNIVVFLVRSGGQSQFSAPINLQTKAGRSDLLRLITWLETQLAKPITVEQMADFMSMSVRSLHRHCQTTFNITPAQILGELRLERGRSLLHQINLPIKSIAIECGFSDSSAFSKAFKIRFGVAPISYRKNFQAGGDLENG